VILAISCNILGPTRVENIAPSWGATKIHGTYTQIETIMLSGTLRSNLVAVVRVKRARRIGTVYRLGWQLDGHRRDRVGRRNKRTHSLPRNILG